MGMSVTSYIESVGPDLATEHLPPLHAVHPPSLTPQLQTFERRMQLTHVTSNAHDAHE
jgi:hypothetical protein